MSVRPVPAGANPDEMLPYDQPRAEGRNVGILLIHGAGYQKDDSRRYLQRQRLRAGLVAGFVAAERIAVTDALNEGDEQVPFPVRMVEYSDALHRTPPEKPRGPELTPVSAPASEWGELPKLRCLCCKRTRAIRANVRDWVGGVGRDLSRVTDKVIQTKMPDVHHYLRGGPRAATALSAVHDDLMARPARVVVAHSLGSVVAVDALARVPHEHSPELLVTVGSPLRFEAVRKRMNAAVADWIKSRSVAWLNVHDEADVITAGGSLTRKHYPGVLNLAVHNGSHYHAADYYLRHRVVGALLWNVAAGDLARQDLQDGLPPIYRDMVRYRGT